MRTPTWQAGRVRNIAGRGLVRTICLVAVSAAMASACAAGPSQRPDLAMSGRSDGVQGEPTESEPDAAPAMEAPRSELDWRDCTARARAGLALPAGPSGLRLECATLKGDLDPETTIASL